MGNNRLTKLCKILKSPQNVSGENVSHIFHYTYEDNKEKITFHDKAVFLLSRIDHLLDENEGIQILEPYYHACGALVEDEHIDKDFYKILRSVNKEDINNTLSNTWVLCFSKNGNSNFLKRRYAAGDGWILGINFGYLKDVCMDFPNDYGTIDLYEVKYSFKYLMRFMKTSISKYYEFCKQEPIDADRCKKEIVNWLSAYSFIYKNADYKQEEEIRLVCKFDSDFLWKSEDHGVQFESSVIGGEPTIKIVLDKEKLVYESQKLEKCFDTRLNKTILSGEEIRKVFHSFNN